MFTAQWADALGRAQAMANYAPGPFWLEQFKATPQLLGSVGKPYNPMIRKYRWMNASVIIPA